MHKLTHNTLEDMLCGIMRNRFDMLKGQNKAISSIAVCVWSTLAESPRAGPHTDTPICSDLHTHVQTKD